MNNDHAYNGDDFGVRGSTALGGFVVGALIGAGLALLLAPATGTDTRRKIGDVAKKVRDSASDRFGSVREGLDHLKNDAKSAIDGGREAYRQSRETTSSNLGA
jgi:gas vesicle protein